MKGRSLPSSGPALLNTGLVKRKQREKLSLPAAVPTGIFRGRIVLSRLDKPEEKPPFSASLGLRTHGKPPRSKYADSIAVLLQPLHLTYRKERSGGTLKKKKSAPQMSAQGRRGKAVKPASPRPRSETAAEPSPGAKGRREKTPKSAAKDRAPRRERGRRRPGVARGLTLPKQPRKATPRTGRVRLRTRGKGHAGSPFWPGTPKQPLQQLIIFLSVLGYCWCPPRLPPNK